jgi:hypothetical protein
LQRFNTVNGTNVDLPAVCFGIKYTHQVDNGGQAHAIFELSRSASAIQKWVIISQG